ncbi:MAG: hypothetical protein COB15_03280 [Flavobacteriales bacterium]|nr:MAG: hypothetical protein COB15_03280 [Flavobacteriales bacterium]
MPNQVNSLSMSNFKIIKKSHLKPCSDIQNIWSINTLDREELNICHIILNGNIEDRTKVIDDFLNSNKFKTEVTEIINNEEKEFFYNSFHGGAIQLILTKNSFLQFCSFKGDFENMTVITPSDYIQLSMEYSNGIKHGTYCYNVNNKSALELKFKHGYVVEDLYTYKDFDGKILIEGVLRKNYKPINLEDIIHDFEYEDHEDKIGEWNYF